MRSFELLSAARQLLGGIVRGTSWDQFLLAHSVEKNLALPECSLAQ